MRGTIQQAMVAYVCWTRDVADVVVSTRLRRTFGKKTADLAASADSVAIDVYGSSLLGRDWRDIGHIRMADMILGSAETTATHTFDVKYVCCHEKLKSCYINRVEYGFSDPHKFY
jgi:hypothetical protein